MALQELQASLIEFLNFSVDGRMRAAFKHENLGIANLAAHRICETCRGHLVGTSEGNHCRGRYSFQVRGHIVAKDRIGLLQKGS